MQKTFFSFFKLFGLLLITSLFLTCYDDINILGEQNKAVVSFSVTDNWARTVFPEVALNDVILYKLLGGRNGATETELIEFTTVATSLTLDTGTWNFTLNGYNKNGQHILQGKIQNRQITLTGNNLISFTLSGLKNGTGNIQITINFPLEAGITRINVSGDIVSENYTTINNGNFVFIKNVVNAGDLLINFELYKEDVLRTVVSELVQVRNSLTSSKTITLVGENLKPLPSVGFEIELVNMTEWALTDQVVYAIANTNKTFSITGSYITYQWYLDGASLGTTSSYTFNKPNGIYQLVIIVTNSAGESRSGRCRIIVGPITGKFFSEDFEEDTHSFSIVNGTQTNQWHVGTAIAGSGLKSAYISNDNGISNIYTLSTSSTVHMYRDVTFPISTEPFSLTFTWRAQGQSSSYDYLRVRLVETSISLTAGSQPSAGTILGTYNLGGTTTWNNANISILATNSGTTKRLVFTWYNDSSSGTQPPVAVDDIVLSTITRYTVAFNANNGIGTTPVTQTVNSGESIILPNANGLTRNGYTFGGWNTNTNGTGTNYNVGSTFTPTGNVILYARWIGNVTVTFDANGGSGTIPNQTVNTGSSITLPSSSGLIRSGYTFSGWNTNASGTGTNYDASTPYTPTNNITLYAKWTSTITYNINNGNGTIPTSQTIVAGNSVTLAGGGGFTRSGFSFGGWNTSADGTGTNYNDNSSFTPTGNITLHARWIAGIFNEDFEGTNSFTVVNGTYTNQWHVGTAVAYTGSKSAYISSNNGSSNEYNTTAFSRVHMYRDITFPTSPTPYTLSFYWRGYGEWSSGTSYDYLRVYLVETTTSINAGSEPSGTVLGTYSMGSSWRQAIINIPESNSGTTKRLVFSWVNDYGSGSNPPAAIDNILLTR